MPGVSWGNGLQKEVVTLGYLKRCFRERVFLGSSHTWLQFYQGSHEMLRDLQEQGFGYLKILVLPLKVLRCRKTIGTMIEWTSNSPQDALLRELKRFEKI
jgi:hypothetical protein